MAAAADAPLDPSSPAVLRLAERLASASSGSGSMEGGGGEGDGAGGGGSGAPGAGGRLAVALTAEERELVAASARVEDSCTWLGENGWGREGSGAVGTGSPC